MSALIYENKDGFKGKNPNKIKTMDIDDHIYNNERPIMPRKKDGAGDQHSERNQSTSSNTPTKKRDHLQTSCNNLTEEEDQLQTRYNNLTKERDQLQTSNNTLTKERDQLQTSYNTLTKERDQLQASYNTLTKERDQLQASYNNLTNERDQLQKETERLKHSIVEKGESNCLMTVLFDILCISSHVTYKQTI
uniref:Uncharacterized protein n=1 Tax=Hucho hucho TaxID=62062 RepID=A0A4W5K184_9TELE